LLLPRQFLECEDIFDGLVKSRKLDFLPQDVGYKIEKATISCGQNKMLGLFTSASFFNPEQERRSL